MKTSVNRRQFIEKSGFTTALLAGIPLTGFSAQKDSFWLSQKQTIVSDIFPSQETQTVREVVGAAHSNLDRVKELVTARPALAKAAYDWGFGDWESALGAAAHMGRRDIAEFLISHGARADIYTLAMLGQLEAVKAMVTGMPGIQRILGPHGISLLNHAKHRLRWEIEDAEDKRQVEATVEYLESLGDAGLSEPSADISEEEKEGYLGKYIFGAGERDYFMVNLNMRGMLSIARGEDFGNALNRIEGSIFAAGGAPDVRIVFKMSGMVAHAVTIHDPEPIITATRP